MSSLIPDDLAELFEGGVSILVGTRDAARIPEATRGVGAIVHPDRRRLTIFIPVDVSELALKNLGENGLIAVGFSSILDHKTIQVKGTVENIRSATDPEREIVSRYHAAFSEVLYIIGLPRAVTRTLNTWPCHAVTFAATDIFLQTPGPNAGQRMAT